MCLVGLLPLQAGVTFTAACLEMLRNLTITIRQEHCGNLLGTEKPQLPTACSLQKSFSRVNHYPFFQNHLGADALSKAAPALTSILFFYHNQAFLFISLITTCLPRTFETFHCLICSILPPNLLVLLLPSPTLFSFEPMWTSLCQSPESVSEKFAWLPLSLWFDSEGEKKIHIALECLWNLKWVKRTNRKESHWVNHAQGKLARETPYWVPVPII